MGIAVSIISGIFLLLLIMTSALFSFSEMAITSSNKGRLKTIVDNKSSSKREKRQAERVIHFIENYNEHISAIVIFNNIVNILTTTLATVYFTALTDNAVGPILAFSIMTPLVIIFGEIIPKQLAKKFPETGTMRLSRGLAVVNGLMRPITFVLSKIIKEEEVSMLNSDEEIHIALEEAVSAGVTTSFEQLLIKRSLELDETLIRDVMIPRKEVVTLPKDIKEEDIKQVLKDNKHTRFPMIDSKGNVSSIFSAKRYLLDELAGVANADSMKEYQLPFETFDDDDNPFHIFEALRNRREKMGIIVDENDKFIGAITIEDIIELLFGEIYDEDDVEKDGVYDLNSTSFIVLPDVKTEYFFKTYLPKINFPEGNEDKIISEFVNEVAGKELKPGQHTTYKNVIIWAKEDTYNSDKIIYEIDLV